MAISALKVRLSRKILIRRKIFLQILSNYIIRDGLSQKTISRYCPYRPRCGSHSHEDLDVQHHLQQDALVQNVLLICCDSSDQLLDSKVLKSAKNTGNAKSAGHGMSSSAKNRGELRTLGMLRELRTPFCPLQLLKDFLFSLSVH